MQERRAVQNYIVWSHKSTVPLLLMCVYRSHVIGQHIFYVFSCVFSAYCTVEDGPIARPVYWNRDADRRTVGWVRCSNLDRIWSGWNAFSILNNCSSAGPGRWCAGPFEIFSFDFCTRVSIGPDALLSCPDSNPNPIGRSRNHQTSWCKCYTTAGCRLRSTACPSG